MVFVPEGEFIMGGKAETVPAPGEENTYIYGDYDCNEPEKIYLPDFYIDKYEVTWEEFDEFSRTTNYKISRIFASKGFKQKPFKNPYSHHLTDSSGIFYIDDMEAWSIDRDKCEIIHTEDGGKNWETLYKAGKYEKLKETKKIFFTDKNNGWVLTPVVLLHTENEGKTWQTEIKSTDPMVFLIDFCFLNSTEGWVTGNKGLLLYYEL
jgi:hypothetical protein